MAEKIKCKQCGKNEHDPKWMTCYECAQKIKAEKQGQTIAPQVEKYFATKEASVKEIADTLEECLKAVHEMNEKNKLGLSSQDLVMLAMHLNNQFWKNARTPRGD